MEDDLNKKWKTNQSTKINLIGCDTIVNSPSVIMTSHLKSSTIFWQRLNWYLVFFCHPCLVLSCPSAVTLAPLVIGTLWGLHIVRLLCGWSTKYCVMNTHHSPTHTSVGTPSITLSYSHIFQDHWLVTLWYTVIHCDTLPPTNTTPCATQCYSLWLLTTNKIE